MADEPDDDWDDDDFDDDIEVNEWFGRAVVLPIRRGIVRSLLFPTLISAISLPSLVVGLLPSLVVQAIVVIPAAFFVN